MNRTAHGTIFGTTRTTPAAIYFLSATLADGGLVTMSREGNDYVIRGGRGTGVHAVAYSWATGKPEDHLARYVAASERLGVEAA